MLKLIKNFKTFLLGKCAFIVKLQVFKAEMESAKTIDPKNYHQKRLDERSKVLSVGAGKTGTIDVNAKKVLFFSLKRLRKV